MSASAWLIDVSLRDRQIVRITLSVPKILPSDLAGNAAYLDVPLAEFRAWLGEVGRRLEQEKGDTA